MLLQFLSDEGGQDLIEYALLSLFIGICCVGVWVNIENAIEIAYETWDADVQELSECTPDPGGGGC